MNDLTDRFTGRGGFAALVLGGLVIAVAWPRTLGAQAGAAEPRAAASAASVRIRDLQGLGRKGLVQTPVYRTNGGSSTREAKEWSEIIVTFDTGGSEEWIDALDVTCHVLLLKEENNERVFVLLRGNVTLLDVREGNEHLCAFYVRPGTILRHGEVAAVHVDFAVKGESLADAQDSGTLKLGPKWWENDKVTRMDGLLLERSRTPFALIDVDNYETVRE